MSDPSEPLKESGASEPPILAYQSHAFSPLVTVRSFYSALDAQLYANELDAAGISCALTNQNTNTLGPYSAFSPVELQVRKEDAEEAQQRLATLELDPTDVEPEHDVDPSQPVPHPSGEGQLITAVSYDTPREMYDAAAALGAARVECFLPTLVPRTDRPRGTGKRFSVRVREDDVEQAREVLAEENSEENDDEEDVRCPKCDSWRTYPVPGAWRGLLSIFTGRPADEPRQFECLKCHHRFGIS